MGTGWALLHSRHERDNIDDGEKKSGKGDEGGDMLTDQKVTWFGQRGSLLETG